jgi:hypothetical protein
MAIGGRQMMLVRTNTAELRIGLTIQINGGRGSIDEISVYTTGAACNTHGGTFRIAMARRTITRLRRRLFLRGKAGGCQHALDCHD